MRLYFSRKFCLFQAIFSTFSPSAFLRCSAKLSLLRSFSLGGWFRGGAPRFLPLHNEKPASAGFSYLVSRNYLRGFLIFACAAASVGEAASAYFIPRNYLRGFLMFACAAAWMSEAASAHFIPRNYLRGFLIFACAAAWMSEAASAHFIPRNYLRGFLMFACAAASLAIGTRKGEQET